MVAERVFLDGKVLLRVNGQILPPVAFMTYYPNAKNFSQFRDIGTPFYSFGAYATDYGINDFSGLKAFTPHFFVGENTYDFSDIDRVLELIAPGGEGGYIFPRVYVDCPKWWAEKYPDELCMDNRGERHRQSFASMVWRKDAWAAMRALIDHINASKWRECVVGYHIAAGSTEEWTYHHHSDLQYRVDYSQPNLQYFIQWLRRKYQTVDALNRAWKKDYGAFEEATFPTQVQRLFAYQGVLRDAKEEMQTIDFWDYSSWLFADTIVYFGEKIKEYTQGHVLTGAFYGYGMMLARSEKNHFALHDVLASPAIDFVAATHGGAEPGQSWPYGVAVDSARLNHKLFFSEGDVRTCRTGLMRAALPHAATNNSYYDQGPAWMPLESMELTLSVLKKACLRVLTGQTGVWWFDMFGGWFDAPEMLTLFRRFNALMAEQTLGPIEADVAVILDEGGLKHLARAHTPGEQVINRQRMLMSWMGAPYHTYLAQDLTREDFPVDQYKLYIMLNFVRPADDVRTAVERKLKCGGRTLVWSYLADVDHEGALTDFEASFHAGDASARAVYRSDLFGQAVYPDEALPCPRFSQDAAKGAYSLACFENTTEPAVLCRVMEDHTSIYSLLPALPPALLSDCVLWSDAHLYSRTGDVIYAGGQFVGIHARTAGEKRIYLPFAVAEMVDVETGEPMTLHNHLYADFKMKQYETRMFRIKK